MADNYLYIDDNGKEQEGTLAGGTGITVAFNGTTRTETITNAGVTHVNSIAGDVTLAAGTGITITPSGSTLTIDATASGSYVNLQTGTLSAQNGSADITGQGTNPGLVVSSQSGYAQIHVVPGASSLSVSPSDGDIMTLSDGSLYARLQSVWAQVSIPQLTSFPVGYAAGYQVQRTDQGYATFEYTGSGWNQLTIPSGTAFPGSPITGLRFYRGDRNIEYYYDGTRWLSTELFKIALLYTPQDAWPLTNATNLAGISRVAQLDDTYSIYLEKMNLSTTVVTTLNSTNYWTINLVRLNSAAAATTVGTVSSWAVGRVAGTTYPNTLTVNAAFLTTDAVLWYVDYAITGAPGNCYPQVPLLQWRLIG